MGLNSDVFKFPRRKFNAETAIIPNFRYLEDYLGDLRDDSAGSSGAFIHLTRAATQSIASGGALVSWDTAGSNGLAVFTNTPTTTTVTIPKDGYYNIGVQLGWSSFTGGGTLTVQRNGATVWAPTDDPGLWTSTSASLFEGTAPAISCLAGDTIGVYINPDDASAQTLSTATLAVYLVDSIARGGLYRELVLSHGPRAYWRLDETSGTTASDIAGHADGPFDATYVSSPNLNQTGVMRDGSGNASTDFDGATDYVTVPQSAVNGLGELTMEAWIYRDDNTEHAIFGVNNTGLGGSLGGEYNRWVAWATTSDIIAYRESLASSAGVELDGVTSIAKEGVYHIVITRTAPDTVSIYVNGVLDASTSGTAYAVSASGDTVQIAMEKDSGGNSDFFDGRIDEVAIYDRALTAAEILQHYQVGGGS